MVIHVGRIVRALANVRYAVLPVLYVLSFVCPKDDTLWVFGAYGGRSFVDNSKYLYRYTVEERPNIRAVWLSRNQRVIEELQSQGYEAYHTHSLTGILLNLRARYVFVSHGTRDVNMWCSGGATVVSLWHGVMLKQVKWDAQRNVETRLWRTIEWLKYTLFKKYDWFMVTSDAMIEPFASGHRMDRSRVLVTGYPRNDLLDGFCERDSETDSAEIYETAKQWHEDHTVLLYAPTYHDETNQRIQDHLDLSELDAFLTAADAYLIFKLHPREQLDTDLDTFERIRSMSPRLDLYPLLPYTDALITDYSSLYFDYLLLDRPVIFYPFDKEQYRSTRGFNLDYDAVTPGPVATEFDELLAAIESVIETDQFSTERSEIRNEFLQQPAHSRCKTICDRFDPTVTE